VSVPLLVTGGTGYLGGELLRAAGGGVATTHLRSEPDAPTGVAWQRLDVRDRAAVDALFERLQPAAVIHSAYRQDGPGARETNVGGSANVAAAAAGAGARLIHLSTDLVFDGASSAPYTESDPPNPLGDYGQSKLDAERSVLAAHPGALVARTSLMVGGAEPGRQEKAVLAAARGESELTFFDDELRSPVLVGDLAVALLELVARDDSGVLHMGGPEALSRYELARLVASAHGVSPERLRRGSIAGSGLERAADCVLDSSRARRLLASPLRGPRQLERR
jgi:dTDP-4-dehydrorhamnose reductase